MRMKKCKVFGVNYNSVVDAAKELNVDKRLLWYWINKYDEKTLEEKVIKFMNGEYKQHYHSSRDSKWVITNKIPKMLLRKYDLNVGDVFNSQLEIGTIINCCAEIGYLWRKKGFIKEVKL